MVSVAMTAEIKEKWFLGTVVSNWNYWACKYYNKWRSILPGVEKELTECRNKEKFQTYKDLNEITYCDL